jgi:hypothetical protein
MQRPSQQPIQPLTAEPMLQTHWVNLPLARTKRHNKDAPPRHSSLWTDQEDNQLRELVGSQLNPDWYAITAHFPSRLPHQVVDRWKCVLDPNLVKGSWTHEEDQKILAWVEENGAKKWSKLAETLTGRIGKQVRERYHNGLKPGSTAVEWSQSEDDLVFGLQLTWGNKWETIASFLPGRSANSVKNRWNSTLKNYFRASLGHEEASCRPATPRSSSCDRVEIDVPFDL